MADQGLVKVHIPGLHECRPQLAFVRNHVPRLGSLQFLWITVKKFSAVGMGFVIQKLLMAPVAPMVWRNNGQRILFFDSPVVVVAVAALPARLSGAGRNCDLSVGGDGAGFDAGICGATIAIELFPRPCTPVLRHGRRCRLLLCAGHESRDEGIDIVGSFLGPAARPPLELKRLGVGKLRLRRRREFLKRTARRRRFVVLGDAGFVLPREWNGDLRFRRRAAVRRPWWRIWRRRRRAHGVTVIQHVST